MTFATGPMTDGKRVWSAAYSIVMDEVVFNSNEGNSGGKCGVRVERRVPQGISRTMLFKSTACVVTFFSILAIPHDPVRFVVSVSVSVVQRTRQGGNRVRLTLTSSTCWLGHGSTRRHLLPTH